MTLSQTVNNEKTAPKHRSDQATQILQRIYGIFPLKLTIIRQLFTARGTGKIFWKMHLLWPEATQYLLRHTK